MLRSAEQKQQAEIQGVRHYTFSAEDVKRKVGTQRIKSLHGHDGIVISQIDPSQVIDVRITPFLHEVKGCHQMLSEASRIVRDVHLDQFL